MLEGPDSAAPGAPRRSATIDWQSRMVVPDVWPGEARIQGEVE
jgi:hypothetical protein